MRLENPSKGEMPTAAWMVDYSRVDTNAAIDLAALPKGTDLRDGSWTGKFFKVKGAAITGRDLKVRVLGKVFDIYAPGRDVRDRLMAQGMESKRFEFYGELGTYRGNWQFVVRDAKWVP